MASREVQAIIGYVKAAGIPYRVTSTVRYPAAGEPPRSYHEMPGTGGTGLAVDFAGTVPGTSQAMVAQMSAIWRAFRPAAPKLAELIFQAPEILMVVKNGVWRPGLTTLGRATWDAHRNHVHVAVRMGTFLVPPAAPPPPAPAPPVPSPVHDYSEAATKTTMIHIGPLDANGNGWADWQPGLGRDPIIVAVTQRGPSPPDDGYWADQAKVNLSAQPRGGSARIVVRGGQPGDTVTAWITVA